MLEKLLFALTDLVVKRAKLVFWVGLILSLLGGFYSVLLYKNLRTDIEELLPASARSVRDLNEVAGRLKAVDNIVLLVFSKDTAQSKRFVQDLAQKLDQAPRSTVAMVEYRIDRELEFFRERRALYIDLEDLFQIRNYIRDRIDYEKELYNPLTIFSEKEIQEPQLDYEALKKKYEGKVAGYDRFPGGFYATPDEKIRAMIVYMPGKGLDKAHRLKDAIVAAVNELRPQSYASDLEVKYTGNGQNLIEESAALVEDLELSTVVVMILVTVSMVWFYRSWIGTMAIIVSLLMGTFWTFGASYFAVGYLNANTAFLASIVLGNGINFGIIFLARYFEERRSGKNHYDSTAEAIRCTTTSTATAALAAGLSYGSLMLTGFRGFSQFGVIGLIGMILCWISAFTLLPALLTLAQNRLKERWVIRKASRPIFAGAIAWLVQHLPLPIWILSAVGIVLSVWMFQNTHYGVIETDLSKLRDKRSMERGSGALYHYIDDIFQHSFSPMVILPKDRGDTQKIAQLLRERKKQEGEKSLITTIQTLEDFVPQNQSAKVAVIREIQRLLPQRYLHQLPPTEKRLVDELLHPKSFRPFSEMELPPLILERFKENDGTLGKIVLVDKVIERVDDASKLGSFVQLGRDVSDSVAVGTPVAGDLPISYDMFQAILKDGPRATLFAFLSVVILVIVLFRNFKTAGLVLFSLIVGVIWLAGIILGFQLKINFLNFIALPITFGIGVDYGVNIFQRYRQEGSSRILEVVRNTGGAVMLCSLTTMIGYGSLLVAGNQAFVSFGALAVVGEVTCMIAAVVSLPAFLYWFGQKRKRILS